MFIYKQGHSLPMNSPREHFLVPLQLGRALCLILAIGYDYTWPSSLLVWSILEPVRDSPAYSFSVMETKDVVCFHQGSYQMAMPSGVWIPKKLYGAQSL